MAGACKICGFHAGIFNLKDGICKSCIGTDRASNSGLVNPPDNEFRSNEFSENEGNAASEKKGGGAGAMIATLLVVAAYKAGLLSDLEVGSELGRVLGMLAGLYFGTAFIWKQFWIRTTSDLVTCH